MRRSDRTGARSLAVIRALAELLPDLQPEPTAGRKPGSVGPARYCLIRAAAAATGLTEKAIRRKIEEGHWVQNKHYRKAPDGHIFIDMKAFERWVEGAIP